MGKGFFIPMNDVPNLDELLNGGPNTGSVIRDQRVTEQTATETPQKPQNAQNTNKPQGDFIWGWFFFDEHEIYSDGNKVYFNGEVSKSSMNALKREVINTAKRMTCLYNDAGIYKLEQMPIKLYINSPGGAMSAGWDFIDFMEDFHLPIHTIGTGTVASMGVNLLLAGDKRFVTANTHLLVHQFSASVGGKRQDILDYMKHFDHMQDQIVSFISKRTKLDDKEVNDLLKSESWLTAKDALDKGFCDSLIG